MCIPKVVILVGCLGLVSSQACAEDDFTASLRLRGGFDSNPLFSLGQAGGSAFVAADTALAAGTKADGYTLGVAAEANAMHYAQPQVTPARGGKVILRAGFHIDHCRRQHLRSALSRIGPIGQGRSQARADQAIRDRGGRPVEPESDQRDLSGFSPRPAAISARYADPRCWSRQRKVRNRHVREPVGTTLPARVRCVRLSSRQREGAAVSVRKVWRRWRDRLCFRVAVVWNVARSRFY